MLEMTASVEKGKANLKHNLDSSYRATLPHTNLNENIIIENIPVREVYHELFDSALSNYNSKQTRNDRKISNYYEYITNNCIKACEKAKSNNKKKCNAIQPFNELVITCGNCIDNKDNRELQIKMLKEIYNNLKKSFPQLRFFSSVIHNDELGAPHLHADFVPYAVNQTRGLKTKVAFDKSLEQMGIKREKALVNNMFIGKDGSIHERQPTLWNGFRNKIDNIINDVYKQNAVKLIRANADEALNIKNINEYKEKKSTQQKAVKVLVANPTQEIQEQVTEKVIQTLSVEDLEKIIDDQKEEYKEQLREDENFHQEIKENIKTSIAQKNTKLKHIEQEIHISEEDNKFWLANKIAVSTGKEKELLKANYDLSKQIEKLRKQNKSLNKTISMLKDIILDVVARTNDVVYSVIFRIFKKKKEEVNTKEEFDILEEMTNDFKEVKEAEHE